MFGWFQKYFKHQKLCYKNQQQQHFLKHFISNEQLMQNNRLMDDKVMGISDM